MTDTTHELEQTPVAKYDRGYKWLHWSMAFLVLLMLFALIGFAQEMTVEEHMTILTGHSSIGTIISLLLLVRLTKRFVKRDPQPQHILPRWQQMASKSVQFGLYFCMVFIPVTGYLTARFHELPVKVFGNFDISQAAQQSYDQATFDAIRLAHELGIKLIMVLLVLHIGAAFYHRLVKKDGVLASITTAK